MQETTIYNKDGEPLTELAQWDRNIQIQIREKEIDSAYKVHFFNCNSKEAMVVESAYKDGTLTVPVPNDILTEPHPIAGYVWIEKNEEEKSVFCFRIMVRKRPRPANYVYEDQKEYITFKKVLAEAEVYANKAKSDADSAKQSATDAEKSASLANTANNNANASKNAAENSRNAADSYASNAATSAATASNKASEASNYADLAKSYAEGTGGETREGDETDNSKFWSEQSRQYRDETAENAENAKSAINEINAKLGLAEFSVDDDGFLVYTDNSSYNLTVNDDGDLYWEVA